LPRNEGIETEIMSEMVYNQYEMRDKVGNSPDEKCYHNMPTKIEKKLN
jgi:hypothetical protein